MREVSAKSAQFRGSAVLADAAHLLSDKLLRRLEALSHSLRPFLESLEAKFDERLVRLKFDSKQRRALRLITPGAAVRLLISGGPDPLPVFQEQVEYNGRRLAKLNLPPNQVLKALAEYDALLVRSLESRSSAPDLFHWVREQLHFLVVVTLNNSYYQVREEEMTAHADLFRVETESRQLQDLLEGSMAILARYCRAADAQVFLLDEISGEWVPQLKAKQAPPVTISKADSKNLEQPFCWVRKGRGKLHPLVLDPAWRAFYPTVWSMPLTNGKRTVGVMQFAFPKEYEWLPREQDILHLVAERCWLGAEKVKLMQSLAESEEQVRLLASRMMQVEEAERRRISRELHDEAGQSLLCVRLQLEMLEQSLSGELTPALVSESLAKLRDTRSTTEHTIIEIRRLIAALSPAVLEQLGLGPGLRQLVARFQQVHPARVRLTIGRLQRIPKQTENIVYRLVQECMNNIAKHSEAVNVNISVSSADTHLQVLVEDDGVGFRAEDASNKRGSFGLAGLRERVALLGGSCLVESRPRSSPDHTTARSAKAETLNRKARVSAKKNSAPAGAPRGAGLWATSVSGTRVLIELPVPTEAVAATA